MTLISKSAALYTNKGVSLKPCEASMQLCKRLSLLQLTPSRSLQTTQEQVVNKAEEIEKLREEAYLVQKSSSIRARCVWSKEETEKLVELVEKMGKRWSAISKHFINRPPSGVMNRYALIEKSYERGPWKNDEIAELKKLGRSRTFDQIDDWEAIQAKLPHHRPLFLIKQKYKYSLDPTIKHGRWTEEENKKLVELVMMYGEDRMDKVAEEMGTRSRRQCLERWRWQMPDVKKGHFSPEEDALILEAVKIYGTNFAVIQKVTSIPRKPRHISQHYQNKLDPSIDRSPWTPEEEAKLYQVCMENGRNMVKTKQMLDSKRSIRDMWNHFNCYQKRGKKE